MIKQQKNLVLRTRIDSRFARDVDDYIKRINSAKPANPIDRSYVVREAVAEFLSRNRQQPA